MKVSLGSDLHLEFGPLILNNEDNTDVLILAGDIFLLSTIKQGHRKGEEAREFFLDVASKWKDVILLFGNHEFYGSDLFDDTEDVLSFLPKNVRVLDPGMLKIGDVTFVGATMWTSFRNADPLVMNHAKRGMNDFSVIYYDGHKLYPSIIAAIHNFEIKYIMREVDKATGPVVVVTHHAPTYESVAPEYKGDMLNDAYVEDVSEYILNHPKIKIWCHGHTHHNVDYMVGLTRVVSNQRGYIGHQAMANTFKLKTIEIRGSND